MPQYQLNTIGYRFSQCLFYYEMDFHLVKAESIIEINGFLKMWNAPIQDLRVFEWNELMGSDLQ